MNNEKKEIKEIPYKIFDKLMAKRVNKINPYDAFIIEQDGRLMERIITKHRRLNLTRPPKIAWASTIFSSKYPQMLPQFSIVEDILKNSQKYFYALNIYNFTDTFGSAENISYNLKNNADITPNNLLIKKLSSYFIPQDNKIKDGYSPDGYPVLTFANILKYNLFLISEIITKLLQIKAKGMGCPVEIEFAE